MNKILITGSLGQIGTELVCELRRKYGGDNVIATDIKKQPIGLPDGPYEYLDVTDKDRFNELIVKHNISWLIHNASILSATGEQKPHLAMNVNIRGFENALETARKHDLRVFAPSSIAAFGPSTPKINTPDITIMKPTTIYGISKLYIEVLGEYYYNKWAVDFRSLRYPGIISWKFSPGGGTTDYAVDIFQQALLNKHYDCFLNQDTTLPMMYMTDCINATIQFIEADTTLLQQRTYNLAAISFSPHQIAMAIRKHIPEFTISYKPDFRQKIAETWPESLDDSGARKQWNWQHQYDLDAMVEEMLVNMAKKLDVPFKPVITH